MNQCEKLFSSIYDRLDIAIAHAGSNVLDNLFVQNNKLKKPIQ